MAQTAEEPRPRCLERLGKKGAAKRCDVAEATAFLSNTLEGAARETKTTKGGLVVTRREAKVGVCYSASAAAAKEAKAWAEAAALRSVHSAAYAH